MSKIEQVSCALLIIGLTTTTMGQSQETNSEYVAPPDAGPKGKAPGGRFSC